MKYFTTKTYPDLEQLSRQRPHHYNGRFRDPFRPENRSGLIDLLRWKLLTPRPYRKYYDSQPRIRVPFPRAISGTNSGPRVTFLGHASILIQDSGLNLYVDPVLGPNPICGPNFSPFTGAVEQMPAADCVLITHGHFDHLHMYTLKRLPLKGKIVTPLGHGRLLKPFFGNRQVELDWMDVHQSGRLRVTLLPASHWTMRNLLEGLNAGLWGGYLIETPAGATIYVAGDTAYFPAFVQIGHRYSIDLAVFNLGAYEPRWFMESRHMNPVETVEAFIETRAAKMMIVHWGTFRLGDEPVHFPPLHLELVLKAKGLLDRWARVEHGNTYCLQ